MSKLSTVDYDDYSGGLNNTDHKSRIKRSEASHLGNWDITQKGQLKRRDGLTQTGDTQSAAISGLHAYLQSDGDKDILITEGTNLRYLNSTTFDAIDSGFTAGHDFAMVTVPANDKVYIGNEDNQLHSWDRASTTLNSCLTDLGADVPHGNVMRWHKNHMFHANNVTVSGTAYPNRLYWSALGDPETYDTTNDFISLPGGGRLITLEDLGDSLVIFKERSIMFLSGWGDSDWRVTASASNVTNTDEQVGTISPKGVTRVGNEVWFMDDEAQIRRIYQTDFDAFRRDIVSTKIQGTISSINKAQLALVVAWTYNDKVFFAVPTGANTYNDTVLVYDLIASKRTGEEAWTTYTGWRPSYAIAYPTSTTPDLYIASANTKKVYKYAGNDDDGTAIDCIWESKDDDFEYPERYKRYKFGYVTASASSSVDVETYATTDNGVFGFMDNISTTVSGGTLGPTGTFELGPTGTTAILSGSVDGSLKFYYQDSGNSVVGKTIMHAIQYDGTGVSPTVNGFTSHFKLRSLR